MASTCYGGMLFQQTKMVPKQKLHAGIRKDSNDVEMMSRLIDYVTFHDLTHSPTSLLGTIADNKLVSSVLGALITGCLLALQGFVNLEIAYDIAGWSIT